MSVTIYKDNVYKDFHVFGYNVYLTNGQGCNTIWFKDVPTARKALKKDGIKTGQNLFDCNKCSCHYSIIEKEHKLYPEHACCELKEKYARTFEQKKVKNV